MNKQKNKKVNLFDKYILEVPPGLKSYIDGEPGKRVLFIDSPKNNFTVSFEEGMCLMDMLPDKNPEVPTASFQCCEKDKYIHMRRQERNNKNGSSYAFFHIELENDGGETVYLPGQMIVHNGYAWSDSIEPVLLELMDKITLSE